MGIEDGKPLFRPGNADIENTRLFFLFLRRSGQEQGETSVGRIEKDDVLELKPLGLVDGHHIHLFLNDSALAQIRLREGPQI